MGEEPLITTEVEVRVIKLKIGNRKGKEEVTGEIIKGVDIDGKGDYQAYGGKFVKQAPSLL